MKKADKYLLVIAGPTAAGKTALSIQLAKRYNTVILSADSRQFYREMSIGTAKPSEEELKEVQHYFINNKSISELYGAGHYEKDALQKLNELYQEHDIIIMVGGSGLYIDAVLNGVDDFVSVPEEVRNNITIQTEKLGLSWLQQEVQKADPNYFENADQQNPQRLKRALEVYHYTGKPYSSFTGKQKNVRNFTAIKVLLTPGREELYKRINDRVDKMMEAGLLEEAKELEPVKHLNALKTVGYKELYEHLEGKTDLPTAISLIKQHSRNYAKRQLTWFKNRDNFTLFDSNEPEKIISYIKSIRGL